MTVREDALAAIDHERELWERLVVEVGEARLTEPIDVGLWTFKDLASHLNGWTNDSVNRLRAQANGEAQPASAWPVHMKTDEEINEWIYESDKEKFASEVLQERTAVFVRLRELVASLTDEQLTDAAQFENLRGKSISATLTDGSFFGHFHEEHESQLRSWFESSQNR